MHGREFQLDSLVQSLDRARTEGGRLVLIGGEAGIGKTRLTAEFLAQIAAADGVLALQGHCQDADPAIPYGPFLDALLQLTQLDDPEAVAAPAGNLAADLQPILLEMAPYLQQQAAEIDPRIQKRRLFEALIQVLSGDVEGRPHAVVLGDLQWADASTRELLPFICGRI